MNIYHIFKVLSRASDYLRGTLFAFKLIIVGGVCIGIPRVGRGVVLRYPLHKNIVLGKNVEIGPFCFIEVPLGAKLNIGNRTKLTAGVLISANNDVFIGNDCLIAEWVSIRDAQHKFSAGEPINRQCLDTKPVRIEDDVWIGRGSAVFRGAYLGRGCIVGSGSQVRGAHLECNGIYVGEPLRLHGYRQLQ